MKCRNLFLWIFFIALAIKGIAQSDGQSGGNVTADTTSVNNLIQQSTEVRNNDPEQSLNLALQAKMLAEKVDFKKGLAYAYKNIGLAYLILGKYIEALQNYEQSLKIFEETKYDEGIANLLGNIGVIYYYQGDMIKSLDYYLKSLKIAERTGNKLRIMTMLNNVGSIYGVKVDTYDKALQYYLQALPLCEELGDQDGLGGISVNVGDIYADSTYHLNDDKKALTYFNNALKAYGPNSEGSPNAYNGIGKLFLKQRKYREALQNHSQALNISEKLNDKLKMVQSLIGISTVYIRQNDFNAALTYFKRAEPLALEINSSQILLELYQHMSEAYAKTRDFKQAFRYQSLFASTKDSVYNNETDKKLVTMQFDFDLEKKQGQINLLTKDKALSELRIKRQKLVRTGLLAGLGLLLMIAALIFRNYRNKVKVNKILDGQKAQIESLLLNILPAEVAAELQSKGSATPRYYERVSVLFTDFVGFTKIADSLSSQEVVAELSECFMAFDEITEKYNLEKIKTIGDAYMCAGGIPVKNEEHPVNIVKACIEIQQFMRAKNDRRKNQGLAPWELRIGVHTGPLVAGVVGKKKYAYDIWGSTVNIASRMESNGEAGKINISSATYELVKSKFVCIYRGKISAKNIGEIDMYFVDHEKAVMTDYESKINIVSKQADNTQA